METRQRANDDQWKRLDKDVGDLGAAVTLSSDKVESLEKLLKTLCGKQEKIGNYMHEMNDKYDSIVAMLAKLSVSKDKQVEEINIGTNYEGESITGRNDGGEGRMNQGGYAIKMNTKLPKIELPQFGGENPRGWASHPRADWSMMATEICRRFAENT
ncbi:Uncharacterized protein Adt_31784 [Abeliophyllum distichum]|uniref:Uncharacterized protein n=1 Tax=Abeliophyllum distichum TaxID=126358 RepID=A0ABD1RGY1_9LAMI